MLVKRTTMRKRLQFFFTMFSTSVWSRLVIANLLKLLMLESIGWMIPQS